MGGRPRHRPLHRAHRWRTLLSDTPGGSHGARAARARRHGETLAQPGARQPPGADPQRHANDWQPREGAVREQMIEELAHEMAEAFSMARSHDGKTLNLPWDHRSASAKDAWRRCAGIAVDRLCAPGA